MSVQPSGLPIIDREEALARLRVANGRYSQQAAWRRDVKEMPRPSAVQAVIGVLVMPLPEFSTMRVQRAVSALPGVGPLKTEKMLALAGVSTRKRVGGLTEPQRTALAYIVQDWADGAISLREAA